MLNSNRCKVHSFQGSLQNFIVDPVISDVPTLLIKMMCSAAAFFDPRNEQDRKIK